MIAAFLTGHVLYTCVYPLLPASFTVPFRDNTQAAGFVFSRLAYAASLVFPMLAVWWIAFQKSRSSNVQGVGGR